MQLSDKQTSIDRHYRLKIHNQESCRELEFETYRTSSSYLVINCVYSKTLLPGVVEPWVQNPTEDGQGVVGEVRVDRGGARNIDLGDETIVVRRFMRGGFVRRFLSNRFYLGMNGQLAETRPILEMTVLSMLFSRGINVPLPVAAVSRRVFGGLYYIGAIGTRAILPSANLLSVWVESKDKPQKVSEFCLACRGAGQQAAKMLETGVFHRDLHVGNVLLDSAKRSYLIDFDRAVVINPHAVGSKYRNALVQRWKRSVNKHQIIKSAVDEFVSGLDSASVNINL